MIIDNKNIICYGKTRIYYKNGNKLFRASLTRKSSGIRRKKINIRDYTIYEIGLFNFDFINEILREGNKA